MRAKSINGNTAAEIKEALDKSMIDGFALKEKLNF